MMNFDIVGALAFFTIGAALVLIIISWMRAKKAQDHHQDAAVAQRQRMEEGTPPREERTAEQRGAVAADRVAPADESHAARQDRGSNTPAAPMLPPD